MAIAPAFLQQVFRLAAALLILAGPTVAAFAQGVPYPERPDGDRRDWRAGEQRAGDFDYYVLALSWSPTHCIEVGDERRDPQCDRGRNGRPYAFVLHGLWPVRARLAAGVPHRRPRLGAGSGGRPHAGHHAEQAAGVL